MRQLDETELAAATEALTGVRGDVLRQTVFEIGLSRPLTNGDAMEWVRELGWLDDQGQFTELGDLIRDPLREYSLWLERGRMLPSGSEVPRLRRENYADKRVIELGSGSGCNLLSLQGLPGRFVGVEPMPHCLQLMTVLAQMADVDVPEAVEGHAESIPFPDNSFDVALSYSAHQYMDVTVALAEMSRVLDDDGMMIIVGNSIRYFVPESITRFARERHLGTLKYDAQAIGNTLAYQLMGRRVLNSRSGGTTGMPVYPSGRFMRRRLDAVGFRVDQELTTLLSTDETALFAVRK